VIPLDRQIVDQLIKRLPSMVELDKWVPTNRASLRSAVRLSGVTPPVQ